MVVVVIIGILAAIVGPKVIGNVDKAQDTQAQAPRSTISKHAL